MALNINYNAPDEDLIDEIGDSLGFTMWNKRDKSKEYELPGANSKGAAFIEGNIVIYKATPLLVYKNKGVYKGFNTIYTLNLLTIKPTKNSKIQKILSQELVEKIQRSKSYCIMNMPKDYTSSYEPH